jgi:3'(2'), 5'-bisphosphate nucleotidase
VSDISLLADLTDIAIDAGARIMTLYEKPIAVTEKDDKSPVTEADQAAEDLILERLSKAAPDIPIVSEEAAAAGYVPEIAERFFLVDPLDGTREYIKRNGEFTVNIALIEHGTPVAGVVYAPALSLLYAGNTKSGAFETRVDAHNRAGAGSPRAITTRKSPQDGLIAIASRSHRDQKTEEFLNHYNVRDIVAAGSSLKFCVVARGEADIYPRHGRTMEWDTAAGHAVLTAAGGSVTRLDGSALTYGKTADNLANPFFIAKGDPAAY